MRNILLKTLVLALVANLAYAEPSSSATEEANTNKANISKPIDGRIFMGLGLEQNWERVLKLQVANLIITLLYRKACWDGK